MAERHGTTWRGELNLLSLLGRRSGVIPESCPRVFDAPLSCLSLGPCGSPWDEVARRWEEPGGPPHPPTPAWSLCSGIPLGPVTSLPRVGCVLATVGKVPELGRKAGRTGRGRRGALQGVGAGPTSEARQKQARRRGGQTSPGHWRSGHHERPSWGPEPPAAGGSDPGEELRGRRGGLGRGRAAPGHSRERGPWRAASSRWLQRTGCPGSWAPTWARSPHLWASLRLSPALPAPGHRALSREEGGGGWPCLLH